MGYGSYSAATAEVSSSSQGKLKVHRMVLAINCGHAVNLSQIEAQVQGSVGTITNTATVTSTTADPVTANNTNAVAIVVKGGTGKTR